jgi:hypothetical protein
MCYDHSNTKNEYPDMFESILISINQILKNWGLTNRVQGPFNMALPFKNSFGFGLSV